MPNQKMQEFKLKVYDDLDKSISTGTPKNLTEAVADGMIRATSSKTKLDELENITICVKDYLRQRIGALMLSESDTDVEMAQKIKKLLEL